MQTQSSPDAHNLAADLIFVPRGATERREHWDACIHLENPSLLCTLVPLLYALIPLLYALIPPLYALLDALILLLYALFIHISHILHVSLAMNTMDTLLCLHVATEGPF